MKIAAITCHNVKNYGSVFQTYATQTYLAQLGHQVFFIDYQRKDTADHEILDARARQSRAIYRIKLLRVPFKAILRPSIQKQIRVFNAFLKSYIHLTEKSYHTNEELKQDCPQADLYVSGSDQIWNTAINHRIERPYFLDFIPQNAPCISIASSFGKATLSEEEKPVIKKLLQKYRAISVREKSGEKLLEQLGIPGGKALMDPTNLLTVDQWAMLEQPIAHPEQYILVYHLRPDHQFDQYVRDLCKKKHMKAVHILLYYHKAFLKEGVSYEVPTPGQVLALIRSASYIVTDSFHMCSFAIKYQKPFVVMHPDNFGERIDNLLRMTGLEQRHVTDIQDLEQIDQPIDYQAVKEMMDLQIEQMKLWIQSALQKVQQG